MQKLTNNEWIECNKSDLVAGDKYRERIGKNKNGWITKTFLEVTQAQSEREWRDLELSNTDWIVPVSDHPSHSAYLVYRQALRDYPNSETFPNGPRPAL